MKNQDVFYDRYLIAVKDERLTLQHMGIYMALCYWWRQNKFQNPLSIQALKVFEISKMKSLAAFEKCLAELAGFGYLNYLPSNHPDLSSTIYLHSTSENGHN